MDTSDSEHFESADEDFYSDDETSEPIISTLEKKLNKVDIVEEIAIETTNVNQSEKNKNTVKHKEEFDKIDNENKNENDTILVTKENEETTPKVDNQVLNKNDLEKKELVKNSTLEQDKNCNQPSECLKIQKRSKNEKKEEILIVTATKTENVEPSTDIQKKEILDKKESSLDENVEEENLWDDNEIDWGQEEALENTVKKDKCGSEKILEKSQSKSTKTEVETDNWDNNDNWDNDDNWDTVEPTAIQKDQEKLSSQPWQNTQTPTNNTNTWGTWGMSSIIQSATQSVSSLTSQVSQGFTSVLESQIGVVNPEELARLDRLEKDKSKNGAVENSRENVSDKNSGLSVGGFGLENFVKLVETTGSKVISGGLDTLETIGKKTMEVLQEGDPGLKKKRAFLKIEQDRPVLSQLLREAKEKADLEDILSGTKYQTKKSKNYETLFDDHQGLVHLEALELLSKQCQIKLDSILNSQHGDAYTEMQETLEQVKELCELPDEEENEQLSFSEIKTKLESAVSELNIRLSYDKLLTTWEETETWLNDLKPHLCDVFELHQQGIESLAQLTAIGVEQFHKTGALLLVKGHRSTADETDSLVQLTTTVTSIIGIVAGKFSEKLNSEASSNEDKKKINELITNIFFEAANSGTYLQDALQLLIPVLQVGAI